MTFICSSLPKLILFIKIVSVCWKWFVCNSLIWPFFIMDHLMALLLSSSWVCSKLSLWPTRKLDHWTIFLLLIGVNTSGTLIDWIFFEPLCFLWMFSYHVLLQKIRFFLLTADVVKDFFTVFPKHLSVVMEM